MAKIKAAKKANKSDKKKEFKKKLNPFELHVNRLKQNVIGRKLKSERGRPGISRSKAIKKRKATLLQEYQIKDKSNRFLDRRIGEKNSAMTAQDKIVARFTAERMKMYKKQIYNLPDDEELTHHGHTLSEIEKFDDPRSDDEDDGTTGKLQADFVEDAHFGGGLFTKSEEGEKKSRKDLIEQLIAESKKRKAEKQKTREQTIELTEKLDTEWKDLLPIVSLSKKKPEVTSDIDKPDSYDILMRQLKFEPRAQASNPLKSETEIEEEEKKKYEELKEAREKRMLGDTKDNFKHRSADDLDDGFKIEDQSEVAISYDAEGNIIVEGNAEDITENKGIHNTNGNNLRETEDSDKNEDDNDTDENSEDDDDDDDKSVVDSLSDLRSTSESEDESEVENKTEDIFDTVKEKEESKTDGVLNTTKQILIPKVNKEIKKMEIAMTEIDRVKFLQEMKKKFPYVPSVPEKYEKLRTTLILYPAEKQSIILAYIIEKNHPRWGAEKKLELQRLFSFLLRYMQDLAVQPVTHSPHAFEILNHFAPYLYDLTHLLPEICANCVIDFVKEKQEEFQKHQHKYPGVDTLILFKVVSLLFPTSDFRHRVVTPCIIFMSQMLFQCRIKTRRDISCGLFLVAMCLEYTVLSKRFCPASINFLCGVLRLAIPKTPVQILKPVPPFKAYGELSELLVLRKKIQDRDSYKMLRLDLYNTEINDDFKVRSLCTGLKMLNEFEANLNPLSACPQIFLCALYLLSKLPVDNYPQSIKDNIQELKEKFTALQDRERQYLVMEKKRPKALRLYEPVVEKILDEKRKKPMGKRKQETAKLLHKVKRERKAAIREIRRDNSFLAKLKWKETLQSDRERKQKVKEIFGAAAQQQGELNKLKYKKNIVL